MREPTAGDLDRLVTFRRSSASDDGFQSVETWADHGTAIPASFQPVSDAERWASGQIRATSMARFVVRWSDFTADLRAADRLTYEEREWEIIGVKEMGRRRFIEVTAVTGAS